MSRKTTTAVKDAQPDLLGVAAQPAKAQPVATIEAKPKSAKKTQAVAPHKAPPKLTVGSPADMLRVIADAATDPKVDPAKMSALLDVQERIAREMARRAFTAAKLAMRPHLPIINKDGRIEILEKGKDGQRVAGRDKVQQSTPYATFENIMEKIDPILIEYGFDLYFTTEPTPDGSRLVVIGHLDHVEGHAVETRFPLPAEASGSKNNVQAWMSSLSYGKRGCSIAILNLRTRAPEDLDRDGNKPKAGEVRTIDHDDDQDVIDSGPPKISQKQAMDLRELIEACGVGATKFCEHYGIEKVSDLPASRFQEATQACKDYEVRKRNG